MFRKLLVVFTLFVLVLVPFAGVQAQDSVDYCQNLSDADCEILTSSTEMMEEVDSFAFDMAFSYDISMGGEAASGMDSMSINLNGSGTLAMDTSSFAEMQSMAMEDPEAYMDQFPAMFDSFLASMEGEASFTLTLPEELSMSMPNEANELPLNLLIENGVFAVDAGALEAATGEGSGEPQWMGIDLSGAFETLMDEMGDEFDMSSFMNPNMMFQGNSEFANKFMTITRVDDSEVNGQSVAVFELILDYGAMMETPEMRDYMSWIYSDMGMDAEMTDSILQMLSGIDLVFHQYIGLDDYYVYRIDMNMDFAMDGETFGDPSMGSMAFGFDFTFDMTDFNVPVDVQIPEDAMVFPFEMLMGSGV